MGIREREQKADYNKVVETHNTVKSENEALKKEVEDLKQINAQKKVDDEKAVWEKEKAELTKQNQEWTKKVEDNTNSRNKKRENKIASTIKKIIAEKDVETDKIRSKRTKGSLTKSDV